MVSPAFILSTGRTGTKFFEEYLNQTSHETLCKHEPRPSRRFKFLSNLYLNQQASNSRIIKTYLYSRRSIFKKKGIKVYIESSNFIFGCIPSLNEWYDDIRIIHIVRHPVGYVKSHLNHGFWRGHKRFFARYVPYWLEKMEVSKKAGPIELLSARWNFVNRQINSYSNTNKYMLVKFEDLFSSEPHVASDKLNDIRQFIGLQSLEKAENKRWLEKPKNYSKRNHDLNPAEIDLIMKNTKQGLKEYGYNE